MAVVRTTVRAPSPNRVTSQAGLEMFAMAAAKAAAVQAATVTTVQAAALRHVDRVQALIDLFKKVPRGAFFYCVSIIRPVATSSRKCV